MSLSTLTHTVPTAEPSLPIDLALETRYSTIKPLNTTIFGDILLARDQMTGERVAIKTVDLSLAFKQQSRANEHVEENVLREVDVLEQVRALGGHPNIVRLHQCYMPVAGQSLHLVLDYCEGGDLYDVCMRAGESTADTADTADTQQTISGTDGTAMAADLEKHISEVEALNYLADVLHGVEFLHAHGIAHRDLSLENILVRRGRAVITDFGLCARQLPRTQRFECVESVGKQYYMAPEVVDRQVYDPRCADVWSLGIALFILLTSSPPFDSAKATDGGFRYVAARGIKPVFQAWGLADKISAETQDLVARMLVVDPRLRITVADMWRHPALAGRRRRSSN